MNQNTNDSGLYPTAGQRQARPSDHYGLTWNLRL